MSKAKQRALIFLVLAGLLTLLLVMSLPNLELLPGQPFSLASSTPEARNIDSFLPGSQRLFNIFRGLIALALVLLPLYIIDSLFTARGRRRLLFHALLMVALFMFADYLQKNPPNWGTNTQDQQIQAPQGPGDLGDAASAPIFSPNPPQWLTLAIVLTGSLITAAVIVSLIWFLRRRASGPLAMERLAEEAQTAIVSLHAGDDFKQTILRCYREMSRELKQERGIARDRAMTAREFETRLVDKGLPRDSVVTLTRLFEQVRYGHMAVGAAGSAEESQALTCLADIVKACRMVLRNDDE